MESKDPYAVYTVESGDEISLTEEEFWTLVSGRRLPGMSKSLFKELKREIDKAIKTRLKGNMMHTSKYHNSAWVQMVISSGKFEGYIPTQKGVTYIKEK
jgi:hypothetical protein